MSERFWQSLEHSATFHVTVGTFSLMQTWAGPSEVPGDAHGKGSWDPDINFTPHEESSFTKGSRKENVLV